MTTMQATRGRTALQAVNAVGDALRRRMERFEARTEAAERTRCPKLRRAERVELELEGEAIDRQRAILNRLKRRISANT